MFAYNIQRMDKSSNKLLVVSHNIAFLAICSLFQLENLQEKNLFGDRHPTKKEVITLLRSTSEKSSSIYSNIVLAIVINRFSHPHNSDKILNIFTVGTIAPANSLDAPNPHKFPDE